MFALFCFLTNRCCWGYWCLLPYLLLFKADKISRHTTDSAIYKNKVLGKSSTASLKIFSHTHLYISICLQLSSYNLLDEDLFSLVMNLTNQKLIGRLIYQISGPAPKLRHQFFPSVRTHLFCRLVYLLKFQNRKKKTKQQNTLNKLWVFFSIISI